MEEIQQTDLNELYKKKFDAKILLENLSNLLESNKCGYLSDDITRLRAKMDFKLFKAEPFLIVLENYPRILFACLREYEEQIEELIKTLKTYTLIALEEKGVLKSLVTDSECFYDEHLISSIEFASILYDSMNKDDVLTDFIDRAIAKEKH